MSTIRKLDFIRYLQEFKMIRLLGLLIFLSMQTPPGPDFDKTCTIITYKRGSCLVFLSPNALLHFVSVHPGIYIQRGLMDFYSRSPEH